MRLFAFIVPLLVASAVIGASQHQTKSEKEYVRRCAPKLISRPAHAKSPEFKFREGEKYKHSPIVAFEILESGEIAHSWLKRGSGVADLDKYAMQWVREFKYNKRPGCGVVESEVGVTIDFTGGQ